MSDPDLEKEPEGSPLEGRAEPIPRELYEAVTTGVLLVADLLKEEAQQHSAWAEVGGGIPLDQPFPETLKPERDALYEQLLAAMDRRLAASNQVGDAVYAVEVFFIGMRDENDEWVYENEELRRQCAVATCRPGIYSAVVSKVTIPKLPPWSDDFWCMCTVIPYLQARLGYTEEGAENALKRVRQASPEIVLNGVDLDDAVEVKGDLISLGCTAQVVEGRPQSTRGEVRRPIPESVRHEVWRRDQGRCVDCGSKERLEFDHIIPFSRGGSNTARNIELRCEPCNRKKGARI